MLKYIEKKIQNLLYILKYEEKTQNPDPKMGVELFLFVN